MTATFGQLNRQSSVGILDLREPLGTSSTGLVMVGMLTIV